MFQSLTQKLSSIFDKIRGKGLLTEEDLARTLKNIRLALIEADVSLGVVKDLFELIKQKALGQEVLKSLQPDHVIIKIIHDELVHILATSPLQMTSKTPFSFMIVGLQGAGKTTTTAKLAVFLKKRLKILLCSLDVYRPAAIEQLKILSNQIGVACFSSEEQSPLKRAKETFQKATVEGFDLVLFDTAGRLHIDVDMMDELIQIKKHTNPLETLLVADSLMGQDAARVARDFQESLGLTGVILTRLDGDSKGGAALSMTYVSKVPIKFIGVGEKLSAFEIFDPKRMVGRILDQGDIVGLVETAMNAMDGENVKDLETKIKKGSFTFEDMKHHIEKMMKMGGMASFLRFIPGMAKMQDLHRPEHEKALKRQLGLINAMTPLERRTPKVLNGSRKKRIAKGSGQDVASLNRLLKQFEQMQIMMKQLSNEKALKRSGLFHQLGIKWH